MQPHLFEGILRNIRLTWTVFEHGEPPGIIGTVSGSASAQAFWEDQLLRSQASFRARRTCSFYEDLPVNQAFGLLLLWQRLKPQLQEKEGALIAFVFGEGTRATPFTETDHGQKPAMASFVFMGDGSDRRYASMVELALRYFSPVEVFLRRSGFDGVVVKWGDELQIPARDISGTDPLYEDADVVRFVSMRPLTEEEAATKDWVGVNSSGHVTAFIPRRPLAEMEKLAARGLFQRREDGRLYGGINLGSIAVSRKFLSALLEEFSDEVNDANAVRSARPDLDPQLFTALTIANIRNDAAREREWAIALEESAAMRKLDQDLPGVLARLRRVVTRFEARHGREVRMVALDFVDQFWGDVGQHRQIFDFYMSLVDRGELGVIARSIAGFPSTIDDKGNLIIGDTKLSPNVNVTNSVLINAAISGQGEVNGSVLIGTNTHDIKAERAFDVLSTAVSLELLPRSGAYKVVSKEPIRAEEGERLTTVFLPDGDCLMRVEESTDLRQRRDTYDLPILGNPVSFADAHAIMMQIPISSVEARREEKRREVAALFLRD